MPAKTRNKFPEWQAATHFKAERALTEILVQGAAHAVVYTPVDTSFLVNSRYRGLGWQGRKLRGVAGYTAPYAATVNDPGHPQNFRLPSAKKEFLRLGFEDSKDQLDAIFERAMRTS